MSLYDVDHVADKITCTVECCECDKVDVIEVLESTTIAELEGHLCANCSDPGTFEKYSALMFQYYGVDFSEKSIMVFYADLLAKIRDGKSISSYQHIQGLNLNDQKTRGI